ncbi:hypothetical protein LWI28_015317 [Acer negundo]|uniref:NB-ARC domain-containing protein n=1 Tax=Acer negundo TaxID=4023 RepID=A0AAD5NWW2_ACENE|nr:hypothetical protein LWI28_015317 [Acer negundo]
MALPTPELVGEAVVKEKIWEYLMGDSVCKIGVCGMGGIGKTTIMEHIHNELLREAKFDKVIWVTVSQEFDVFKLQKEIAFVLSEDLSKYEDKTIRAAMLSKIVLESRKRYVLILDDVGIPEPSVSNGSKLVLTTRSIELALSMGCEAIRVTPLSDGDTLNLFLNHVGRDLYVPTLESTLNEVLKQCAGLPLAIITIGSTMRGQYDVYVWKDALNSLKNHAGSADGMADEVFQSLKFSYDRLPSAKLKHCFLYCALYPEDYHLYLSQLQPGCLNRYYYRLGQPTQNLKIFVPTYEKCLEINELGLRGDSILLPTGIQILVLRYLDNFSVLFRGERDRSAASTPTPPGMFSSLKYIEIKRCPKIEKLFWPELVHNLQNLEEIHVEDCEQLVEIISTSDDDEENKEEGKDFTVFTLPKLREMTFRNLRQLKCICNRGLLMECISLEKIKIVDCPNLKRIPLLLPRTNLEQIYVSKCEQLVEIIATTDDDEENKEEGKDFTVFPLPKLREMTFRDLPQLKYICNRGSRMECNFLEKMVIVNCPKLKQIPILLPQPENGQLLPPVNLRRITINSQEWWDSLEWDHPNIKKVLEPLLPSVDQQMIINLWDDDYSVNVN